MNREFYKIKDSNFVRDPNTNALLNTDTKSVLMHKQRVEVVKKTLAKDEKINNLEKEVSEIKDVLKLILDKVSKQDNN
jgi:hypothetical protein